MSQEGQSWTGIRVEVSWAEAPGVPLRVDTMLPDLRSAAENMVSPLGIPCGPVVRTWCFHCHGPGFSPWLGTKILQAPQCDLKNKQIKKTKNTGKALNSVKQIYIYTIYTFPK